MARDSAQTGDPDTTQGQFPSEIEGEDGGGGGSSPPLETTYVQEPMAGKLGVAGVEAPNPFAFRWDSRPIWQGELNTPGGDPVRYGVYVGDGSASPFRGYSVSAFISPGGATTGTTTLTISGYDFVIGHRVRAMFSGAQGSTAEVQFTNEVSFPSGQQNLFQTIFPANFDASFVFDGMSTGDNRELNVDAPVGAPGLYLRYPYYQFDYQMVGASTANPLINMREPQIHYVGGGSVQVSFNYDMSVLNGSFNSTFLYFEIAGFNRTSLDTKFESIQYV